MSVKDLIANWEEALALAFSQLQLDGNVIELTDGDLEDVEAPHVRSALLAAQRSLPIFCKNCMTSTNNTQPPLC